MANGFYGSLSKLQKINFQFDRVFPNRATMDAEAGTVSSSLVDGDQDPVLIGRYVLVDYNEGDAVDVTLRLGYKQNDTVYAALDTPFDTFLLEENDKIIVLGEFDSDGNYEKYDDEEVWIYKNGSFEQQTNWNTEISNGDYSVYEHNLIVDNTIYPNAGRGWDSTVWQKTYQNGKATYIMIAELNALSPTIAIAPDAPGYGGIPSNPYFSDSTPNFYRMHIGSQWGIRLRGAQQYPSTAYLPGEKRNVSFVSDISNYILPSDVSGNIYLKNGELKDKPLAIYYNKKGFNKFLSSPNGYADLDSKIEYYKNIDRPLQPEEQAIYDTYKNTQEYVEEIDAETGEKIANKNFISLTPTGLSGKVYSNVDRNGAANVAPDMQELSIMLPSLGEAVSQMWDVIYGESQAKDANGYRMYYNNPENISPEWLADNFSSDTNKFRNTDIYWNSTNGIRLNQRDGYNPKALSTLAGTLNSAHDLMGMIIRDYKEYDGSNIEDINVSHWDPTKIYYINGEYYIKNKTYKWKAYEDEDDKSLYNEITPSQMIGVGYHATKTITKDDGTEEIVDTPLYRLSAEEYPIILDEDASENLKNYQTEFMEHSGYNNYIQVKDASDIIEGAIYGTLDVEKVTEEAQVPTLVNEDGEKIYYYYQDNQNDGIKRYTVENPDTGGSPTWDKGIYYTFTQNEIDQSVLAQKTYFYMPDYFYAENIKTGEIHLALESTLDEIYGNNTTEKDWRFYRKNFNRIAPGGSGNRTIQPIYEKDANGNYIYELSYVEIERISNYGLDYRYNNITNTLIIARSFESDDTPIDLIDSIKSETINGIDTISLENGELKGYYSKSYKAIDGNYYLPLEFATIDGLVYEKKNDEDYIPAYKIASYKVVEASVLTGEGEVNVIKFKENTYFYQRDNSFILEEKNNLRWVKDAANHYFIPGNSNGEGGSYYKLVFNANNRKQVYPVGGGYFKSDHGDYIRYFAPHLVDPEIIKNENENDDFYLITFTELQGDYKAFVKNVYYTTEQLTTKATIYDPEATYYERIGNIVGNSEPKWPNGMQWNNDDIPDDVTLGYITPVWEAKKLEGFNQNMTTIYGLIIQLYNKLNAGNEYNRDSNTIQGILNQANDILTDLRGQGYGYHSVNIVNTDNEEEFIEAQSANAPINLRSQTGTVEFAVLENDAISLDLAEKYRDWVVPDKNENETSLIFNNQGKISLDNNTFKLSSTIKRINKEIVLTSDMASWECSISTTSESMYVPIRLVLNGSNNEPAYLAITTSGEAWNGLQENDKLNFYFYNDYEQTKLLGEAKNILVDEVREYYDIYTDPWITSNIIKAIKLEVIRNDSVYATGVALDDNATNAENSFNSYTLDELEISDNSNEYLAVNNSLFKYKDNSVVTSVSDSMTMEWNASENTFYINVNGTPLLRIVKSED